MQRVRFRNFLCALLFDVSPRMSLDLQSDCLHTETSADRVLKASGCFLMDSGEFVSILAWNPDRKYCQGLNHDFGQW